MIVEYIRYKIAEDDRRAGFVAAYEAAQAPLQASPHCLAWELTQCEDDAANYILRIEWDSRHGHLEGFRKSEEFRTFYQAVAPYVKDIEEMRHYRLTGVAGAKNHPAT